jgi:DNA-binding NarL/FixJ family response regulator
VTEREVLKLMAKGIANKQIAAELFISESTVKTHISSIFQKLGVNARTEAVTQAIKKGILRL